MVETFIGKSRVKTFFIRLFVALALCFCEVLVDSSATIGSDPQSVHCIIDAEIEEALRSYVDPMLKIAGIPAYKVTLVIVNTPVVNASAVAGGLLAVNSGLLLKVKSLEELLGVLAHEVGHFKGGHHTRIFQAAQRSTAIMVASWLMGGLAMAAGKSDAGMALLTGGSHVAQQSYLAHRRSEESSADQTAVDILEALHISAKGLASFFNTLSSHSLRVVSSSDAYSSTHPLNNERVRFVENHLKRSSYTDASLSEEWLDRWERVQEKLAAFLLTQEQYLKREKPTNPIAQAYGEAIQALRSHETSKAENIVKQLIFREPQNPFFHEVMGQIFFESGRVSFSLPYYRQALALRPHSLILAAQVSHALIEDGQVKHLEEAIKILDKALARNGDEVMLWHFLALAYGKKGNLGQAAFCLAEKSLRMGDKQMARIQADRALRKLSPKSTEYLRAKDIIQAMGNE